MNNQIEVLEKQITALERELHEVEASLPKHSVQASHMIRIEALEEEIEEKKAQLVRLKNS